MTQYIAPQGGSKGGSNTALIAGIVAGGVVGLLVIIALYCFLRKRCCGSKKSRPPSMHSLDEMMFMNNRPASIKSHTVAPATVFIEKQSPPDFSSAIAQGAVFSAMAAGLAAATSMRRTAQPSYSPPQMYSSPPPAGSVAAPAPTQAPAPPIQRAIPQQRNTRPVNVPRAPPSVEPSQYDNGKDYRVDQTAVDHALMNARKGVGPQHMRPLPPSSDAGLTSISRREPGPRRPTTAESMSTPDGYAASKLSGSRAGMSMSIRR